MINEIIQYFLTQFRSINSNEWWQFISLHYIVHNDDEHWGNELVFDDDLSLNWAIVYEALGVSEPIIYTRSKANNKRKQPSSNGIGMGSSQASKKGGATLASKQSKGKEMIQVVGWWWIGIW